MPALFVFLLKVNIALLLFCAGYYLVLRHLTFYTLNRVYLLAAIVFASIYPQINLSAFAQRHEELARPVLNWQLPAQIPLSEPIYWHWAEVIFWLGAYILAIRLAMQLFSLYRLYKNSKPGIISDHKVRIMDKDAAPFSFWQSIFVNPSKHEPADLKAILLHEQVHVNQWHTADILLAEISSIFYWFNPGIWLMKKAIRENIEFITDQKILNKGIDSKSYQYSLVSVSFNNQQPGIVNHFNISTIKKRIIMMNAKRSSKLKLTRYAFLVPAVVALLLVFSISKADFAKPIRVKLENAVKPLTKMVNPTAIPNPMNKLTSGKLQNTTRNTKAANSGFKADTTKKNKITATNSKGKDTVVYYINGVKSEIRIDENGADTKVLKGVKSDIRIDDSKAEFQPLKGDKVRIALKKADSTTRTNTVVVTGYRMDTQPNVKVFTKNSANHNINVNTDTLKTKATSSDVSIDVHKISPNNTLITNISDGKRFILNIDKGKLVMLDGKEISAADMKKLDPDSFENIRIITGKEATEKYGDKAKNGAVLITTKK